MPTERETYHQFIEPEEYVISGTQSDIIELYATSISGLQVPAGLSSDEISFEGSTDGTNFAPLHHPLEDTLIAVKNSGQAACYPLNPHHFYPWRYVRINFNNPESGAVVKVAFYRV